MIFPKWSFLCGNIFHKSVKIKREIKLICVLFSFAEIFIGATIVLLAFGTGTSIVVVNTYFKGHHDSRPPRWVRHLVFKCLAPMVCMRSTAKEALESHKVHFNRISS